MLRNFRRVIPTRRLIVPRSTPRSFSRYDGLVNVQRVRFKRPWIRRGVSTILTAVVATQVYFALIGPSLDRLEEVDENIDKDMTLETKVLAERDGQHDKDGVPFIPIGLPYSVPGGRYTEDDPEWKTFKEYTSDTRQFKRLRGELVAQATAIVNRKPALEAIVDVTGTPLKPNKHTTIKPAFPVEKPSGYVQPGFELRDDDIAWTTRPIPTNRGDWIRSVFEPWPLVISSWAAGQYLVAAKVAKLRKMLGVAPPEPAEDQVINNQHQRTHTTSSGPPDVGRSRQKYPLTPNSTTGEISKHGASTEFQPSKPNSALQKQPSLPGESVSDFRDAMKIFTLFLLLTRRKNSNKTPQPGAFKMNGVARFRGPKGGCEAHIVGIYEPATKNWHRIEVQILHTFSYKSDTAAKLPPQKAGVESEVSDA
ncbi:hypothetical protein AJ78_06002 [Emergomyces pasteurianus Ep9510]|uniref:Uncharacterized protein n=1 Tax=Emergomyces pasteurianus Ep9510 TaxID=1447872 RepID=A0A1J9PBW9_9EURO|nr:hypothetical protein AJ78_06002 [Emergomyces pasteurianus Ep9510]